MQEKVAEAPPFAPDPHPIPPRIDPEISSNSVLS